jgi:O-Antigen ligase
MGESSLGQPSTQAKRLDLTQRAFWLPIVLIDLLLLLALGKIALVAGLVMAGVAAFAVMRRVEWLLALLLYGMPLFDPLQLQNDQASLLLIGLRLFFLLGWLMLLLGAHQLRPMNSLSATVTPILKHPATWVVLLLPLWLWIGLGWSESPVYGAAKLKSFLLANLFFYLGATFLWPLWASRRALDGLIRAGIFIGGMIAAIGMAIVFGVQNEVLTGTIAFTGDTETSRLAWLGFNPIWLARFLAAWCCLLLWAVSRRQIPPLLGTLLALVGLFLIIRTGSRGPLAALLLSPLALLLLPRRVSLKRVAHRLWPAVALVCLVVILLVLFLPAEQQAAMVAVLVRSPLGAVLANESISDGVTHLLGDQLLSDRSSLLRRALIETAWQELHDTLPWGTGIGGFSAAMFSRDIRIYPHNLEIELLFENGWPGLLLMLIFLVLMWRIAFRLAQNTGPTGSTIRWIWLLFAMAFLNAQISGDLSGNSHLWFWGGMIVAMQICCRNKAVTRHIR